MKMLNHGYFTLCDGKKIILDMSLVIFLSSGKITENMSAESFCFVR